MIGKSERKSEPFPQTTNLGVACSSHAGRANKFDSLHAIKPVFFPEENAAGRELPNLQMAWAWFWVDLLRAQ